MIDMSGNNGQVNKIFRALFVMMACLVLAQVVVPVTAHNDFEHSVPLSPDQEPDQKWLVTPGFPDMPEQVRHEDHAGKEDEKHTKVREHGQPDIERAPMILKMIV